MPNRFYYLNFKNDIVTGFLDTHTEISGKFQVENSPEGYIGKKNVDGEWVDAEKFHFALLDDSGAIINLIETLFADEAPADWIQVPDSVSYGWVLLDGNWSAPVEEAPIA